VPTKLPALIAMVVIVMSTASVASAQAGRPDANAGQTVGLFDQSCLRFAGDTAGLRNWIWAHNLPQVQEDQAAPFLGAIGTGEVFGASTPDGKLALVSYDSGACRVVALAADAPTAENMLLTILGKLGVSVSQILSRSKPDGSSKQDVFEATLGPRRWKISITSKPHSDAPNLAPELSLLATAG